MKKLFEVLLVLVILCSLVACGEDKTVTTVCSTNYEGIKIENTMISKNDKVLSITYKNELEVDDSLLPYFEDSVEAYEEMVKDIKGITYSSTIEGNVLTETITIDYTVVDMSKLVDLELLEDVDGQVPTEISLEQSIANMKDIGCTCTEK